MERDDDQLFFSFMHFFLKEILRSSQNMHLVSLGLSCNLASANKMMVVLNRFLKCLIEIIILSISLYLVSSQTG